MKTMNILLILILVFFTWVDSIHAEPKGQTEIA